MRGAGAKWCSGECRNIYRKQVRAGGKALHHKKRAVESKKADRFLTHTCLSNGLDPWDAARCLCRLEVSGLKAERLIGSGEAVDLASRKQIFCERSIVIVGKSKRAPRAALVDRAHLERAFHNEKARKGKSFEDLKRLVAQGRADRAAEERVRIEILGELQVEFLRSITVEVPAEQFDKQKADAWGRPFLFSTTEERTAVGVDGLNLRTVIEVEKEVEYEDVEREETPAVETEQEPDAESFDETEEDERTAEEVLEEFYAA